MEEPPDTATLVASLNAESESARKYAVFKLKGLLNDPSFADGFIQNGGLPALRQAVLNTTGNTQAYALGSLDALLELDMGWECCDQELLEKVCTSMHATRVVRRALVGGMRGLDRGLMMMFYDRRFRWLYRILWLTLSATPLRFWYLLSRDRFRRGRAMRRLRFAGFAPSSLPSNIIRNSSIRLFSG